MSLDPQPITLTGQVASLEPLSMDHAAALLEVAQSEAILVQGTRPDAFAADLTRQR